MKIATWNVARLNKKKYLNDIIYMCENAYADILVLTETDKRINLKYKYHFHTPFLDGVTYPAMYAPTENRVSIFTNYRCVKQYPTYDENTSICVELETEKGNLLVYGTIIGITGNRNASYKQDLMYQLDDIDRYIKFGINVCVIGDFNCSFCDNYYYTKDGRSLIQQNFLNNHISVLTAERTECIDHIAVSNSFISNCSIALDEWNYDKKFSDHKGIIADICD